MATTRRLRGTAVWALLLFSAGGCQGRAFLGAGLLGGAPSGSGAEREPIGAPDTGPAVVLATFVEPGAYAGDARVVGLLAAWDERVAAARDRLTLVTGLTFRPGVAPRVGLAPLGDETRTDSIAHEVVQGRRRPVITVNLESIASGRREVDAALASVLAQAAYEDVAPRGRSVPPWLAQAASVAASGELDRVLLALRRRQEEDPGAARVDPADPEASLATAAAALAVLQELRDPDGLRRFFIWTAEGDDPDPFLARQVGDPLGSWAAFGRDRLAARLGTIDVGPWRILAQARTALEELGGRGLESTLPPDAPGEIRAEIEVLRARAALDAGEYGEARRRLGALDAVAVARLDDPTAARALEVIAERGPGGDPARADELAERFGRDHPRAARLGLEAAAGLRAPTLPEDKAWDLGAERAALEQLLGAYRAGAVRQRLAELGERASAPELADVQRALADAEAEPSRQAVAANLTRAAAWRSAPSAQTAADVRSGGVAGAVALSGVLPFGPATLRRDGLRLMAESGGAGPSVRLLVPTWSSAPGLLPADLDALLSVVTYSELRVWVEGHALAVLERAGGASLWERLRYGLDEDLVRADPDLLRDLRAEFYDRRRAAFDAIVRRGQATPGLVAQGLRDPAPLLRRTAAEAAGTAGFGALVQVALQDEAWLVRAAAVPAAMRTLGSQAEGVLRFLLARDPAPQVRQAALRGLLDLAEQNPALVRELLSTLLSSEEYAPLRDELMARLAGFDATVVAEAALGLLELEAQQRQPRPAVLSHLFLVWERARQRASGYVAGMSTAEVRELVRRMRERTSREAPRR